MSHLHAIVWKGLQMQTSLASAPPIFNFNHLSLSESGDKGTDNNQQEVGIHA